MRADSGTERAVLQVLGAYGDAIANGEVAAILATFTGDEDTMVMGSDRNEWSVGAEQVRALYQGAFTGDTRFSLEWKRTEVFTSGDVAWFGADGTLTADDSRIPYRLSGVLEKRGSEWKLAQFHGSVPK